MARGPRAPGGAAAAAAARPRARPPPPPVELAVSPALQASELYPLLRATDALANAAFSADPPPESPAGAADLKYMRFTAPYLLDSQAQRDEVVEHRRPRLPLSVRQALSGGKGGGEGVPTRRLRLLEEIGEEAPPPAAPPAAPAAAEAAAAGAGGETGAKTAAGAAVGSTGAAAGGSCAAPGPGRLLVVFYEVPDAPPSASSVSADLVRLLRQPGGGAGPGALPRSFVFVGPALRRQLARGDAAVALAAGLLERGVDVYYGEKSLGNLVDATVRLLGAVEKCRSRPSLSAFRSRGRRVMDRSVTGPDRWWTEQLLQIPGVEREAALAVRAEFASPHALYAAVARDAEAAAARLAALPVTRATGRRALGAALAKRIVRIYSPAPPAPADGGAAGGSAAGGGVAGGSGG